MILLSQHEPHIGRTEQGWKIIAATVTGAMHERKGEPGQDAYAVGVDQGVLVAVVCDGAGSAVLGGEGARLCSQLVVEGLLEIQGELTEAFVKERIVLCIDRARRSVMKFGELKEYAATLVGLIAHREMGWFFHIGDGAGVAFGADQAQTVTKPENGTYINETYFFTDGDWQNHLRITAFGSAEALILMSDGVTSFAMLPYSVGVDDRFTAPVFRYLRETDPEQSGRALSGTLGCENARKVSDDDKTFLYVERMPE